MRSVAIAVLFCVLGYFGSGLSGIDRLELGLRDARLAQITRPASEAFVLVAIDARSLDTIGSWPWHRGVHADLVGVLQDAGASEIFFDIDFGFARDADGDSAFVRALAEAGNVSLPMFVQSEQFGRTGTVLSEPLEAFAEVSWPVSVNVTTDRLGLVRDYPYGVHTGDGFVPSAAAFLNGRYATSQQLFAINYSVAPGSIPSFSASDVISGHVPAEAFAGRAVIIGATAIQLGDLFNVPVHGVVPGVLIHAMAAETLFQGIALRDVRLEVVLICLGVALLLLQHRSLERPVVFVGALAATVTVTELVAFQAMHANLVVPTASLHTTLGLFALWQFATRLGLRDWVITLMESEIRDTRGLLDQVFFDSYDAMLVVDETGAITQKSQSALDLFKRDLDGIGDLPADLRGAISKAVSGDRGSGRYFGASTITIGGADRQVEYTVAASELSKASRGSLVTRTIATVSIRDTTQLKQKEREIAYLSTYDPLTGALRRNSFIDFLDVRLSAGAAFAVFAINLKRFKSINLLLGRDVGDAVLADVAARLENAELGLSAPARLDGDTFAVFSECDLDEATAHALAKKLMALISAPVHVDGSHTIIRAHVGFSIVSPGMARSASECLAEAEAALDAARDAQAAAPLLFSPAWSEKQTRARAIERVMAQALDCEEFYLTYQPQHRIEDGALVGSEALVRWDSAELGKILPDEFIALAEANGFIIDLGRWALRTALEETLRLPGDLSVAVNVSGAQLNEPTLIEDVAGSLAQTGFPAHRLCLEMTETVMMSGSGDAVEIMRDVTHLGPTWALDDFGTGYSSLAYLARFPLAKVKLDRSFTQGLGEQPAAETIVRAVRSLSAGLGMSLLCEGVETKRHLEVLRGIGCDEAQGYYFGKPMDFAAFHDYAASRTAVARTG